MRALSMGSRVKRTSDREDELEHEYRMRKQEIEARFNGSSAKT